MECAEAVSWFSGGSDNTGGQAGRMGLKPLEDARAESKDVFLSVSLPS